MLLIEAVMVGTNEVVPVYIRAPVYYEKAIYCDSVANRFDIGEKMLDGSCRVYLNGLRLVQGEHYTVIGDSEISLADDAMPGDIIIVEYMKGG